MFYDIYQSAQEFLEELEKMGAWDISEERNGSVMAWVEESTLYIAGEGGVRVNYSCRYLFKDYKNLKRIKFETCFDTGQARHMSWMFNGCPPNYQYQLTKKKKWFAWLFG